MRLTGWSFTLENKDGKEIKIEGTPCCGSWQQSGGTTEELGHTVGLCEAILNQAREDELLKWED